MFIINTFSTCFGHHYAHLQENKTCVTACGVLRWFCWMWLIAVVGRCLVGYNAAPHNRYQPHPTEPAQHTTCSNTRLVLLKVGIMMPETCWESIDNKHLTFESCSFSLSLHNLLTMHGHRNLKLPVSCLFLNFTQLLLTTSSSSSRHFYHSLCLYFNNIFFYDSPYARCDQSS